MKKIKIYSWICVLTALLCTTSVISIGFAAWTVTKEDISSGSITGNVIADSVDTNIDGVSVSSSVFTMGHYYYENVDNSNNISYSASGLLTYNINFDTSKIDSDILTDGNISLQMTLNFEDDLALFSNDYLLSVYVDSNPVAQLNKDSAYTFVQFTTSMAVNSTHTVSYEFSQMVITHYKENMLNKAFHLRLEAMND